MTPSPSLMIGAEWLSCLSAAIRDARVSVEMIYYSAPLLGTKAGQYGIGIQAALIAAHAAGVRTRLIAGRRTNPIYRAPLGLEWRELLGAPVCHAKVTLIDRSYAIIGSHNLTAYAAARNYEASVTVTAPGDVARLGQFFDALWRSARGS